MMSELASLLEGAGFERSSATFIRRQAENVVTQVTVERFRWSVGTIRKFQLKLMIYLPDRSSHPFSLEGWHPHYTPVFAQSAGYLLGRRGVLVRASNLASGRTLFGRAAEPRLR